MDSRNVLAVLTWYTNMLSCVLHQLKLNLRIRDCGFRDIHYNPKINQAHQFYKPHACLEQRQLDHKDMCRLVKKPEFCQAL